MKNGSTLISNPNDQAQNLCKIELWKILIITDDSYIDKSLSVSLSHLTYDGKSICILHSSSIKETLQIVSKNPDILIIFTTISLKEENNTWYSIITHIRNTVKNTLPRVILIADNYNDIPLKASILECDIFDIRFKNELSMDNLIHTTTINALKYYGELKKHSIVKQSMEKIMNSSNFLFNTHVFKDFLNGLVIQINNLVNINDFVPDKSISGFVALKENGAFFIEACTKNLKKNKSAKIDDVLFKEDMDLIMISLYNNHQLLFANNKFSYYFKSILGIECLIFFQRERIFSEIEKELITLNLNSFSILFDNANMFQELESTQRELIFSLGEIAEVRSKETGYHVKRVSEYSWLLASDFGLPEKQCEILKMASPLHDIGKIAIPDSILNKPGKLTFEEFVIIKTHSLIGYEMLKRSKGELMKAASIVAYMHHEKFDGSGYPQGLSGEDIHIYARITALADVFDALSVRRVYKEPWPLNNILEEFHKSRGSHFDPQLTDIFFKNIDKIINISKTFSDSNTR